MYIITETVRLDRGHFVTIEEVQDDNVRALLQERYKRLTTSPGYIDHTVRYALEYTPKYMYVTMIFSSQERWEQAVILADGTQEEQDLYQKTLYKYMQQHEINSTHTMSYSQEDDFTLVI